VLSESGNIQIAPLLYVVSTREESLVLLYFSTEFLSVIEYEVVFAYSHMHFWSLLSKSTLRLIMSQGFLCAHGDWDRC
jgi:hypothetical protein